MMTGCIRCVDAITGMGALPDALIPLNVISPSYDGLRDFGGHDTFRDLRPAHMVSSYISPT